MGFKLFQKVSSGVMAKMNGNMSGKSGIFHVWEYDGTPQLTSIVTRGGWCDWVNLGWAVV